MTRATIVLLFTLLLPPAAGAMESQMEVGEKAPPPPRWDPRPGTAPAWTLEPPASPSPCAPRDAAADPVVWVVILGYLFALLEMLPQFWEGLQPRWKRQVLAQVHGLGRSLARWAALQIGRLPDLESAEPIWDPGLAALLTGLPEELLRDLSDRYFQALVRDSDPARRLSLDFAGELPVWRLAGPGRTEITAMTLYALVERLREHLGAPPVGGCP